MPSASATSSRSPATRRESATTRAAPASGTPTRPASSASSAGWSEARTRPGRPIGAPAAFTIACALDPTAADLDREVERLAGKLEAGAHLIMTQPIYAPEQWHRFMDRAAARFGDRLPRPVLLGVLPLHTSRHAEFLHHEVPGHHDPRRCPCRDA